MVPQGHRLHHPHGARRTNARAKRWNQGLRLLPRLRLADGAAAAQLRACRRASCRATLIQLTPDVEALDGPSGTEVDFTDLHAWCEVYLPRRRLGGTGRHLRPACGRRVTFLWPARRSPPAPPPLRARWTPARWSLGTTWQVTRIYRIAPRHRTLHPRSSGHAVMALGQAVDAGPGRRRCPPDHGRRAHLRRRGRPRRAPSGTPTPWGPTKRGLCHQPGA